MKGGFIQYQKKGKTQEIWRYNVSIEQRKKAEISREQLFANTYDLKTNKTCP